MNTSLPLISVLMPAYNVKDYISAAIESVLHQSYTNLELIIINDGSTDGSGTIAEHYQSIDSRVKVYHIKNSGPANARNLSLSYAQGEFVTFVDSDDTIQKDYLSCLFDALIKYSADISFCSYYKYVEEEKMYYYPMLEDGYTEKHFTGLEAYQNYYNPTNSYNISFVVAWGKLVKKTLFNHLYFPPGKLFEDSYTIYKLYLLTDKIVYVNKHLYMYRTRSNSIIQSSWTKEKILNSIEQHEERLALLTTLGIPVTDSHKNDYQQTLLNCATKALDNGYIDEYKMISQKLNLIKSYSS